jgi:secretion/DNA translocation related TadE-like protein
VVSRLRSDAGAIEGFVMIALFALTGFAVVIAVVGSVFIHHERARTAADFAALAAAQSLECSLATRAARHNGATLRSCTVDEAEARVTVAVPSGIGGWLTSVGAPQQYLASAHAQP